MCVCVRLDRVPAGGGEVRVRANGRENDWPRAFWRCAFVRRGGVRARVPVW